MSDLIAVRRRLVCLAPLILGACSLFLPPLEPPEVALRAVALERFALNEQLFRIGVRMRNPNQRELRVADARVSIELEGIELGEGFTLEPLIVPALGESDMDIRLVTNLVAKAPEVLAWLASGDTQLDYRLTGFIDVGGAGGVRIKIDEVGQVRLTDINRYNQLSI
jgi:LEA14-like dessication related protein